MFVYIRAWCVFGGGAGKNRGEYQGKYNFHSQRLLKTSSQSGMVYQLQEMRTMKTTEHKESYVLGYRANKELKTD